MYLFSSTNKYKLKLVLVILIIITINLILIPKKNWKENLGKYPTELNELIGNSPLRQDWKKDAWNREYEFTIIENGKRFLITSAGSDGKFGTEDDIKSE